MHNRFHRSNGQSVVCVWFNKRTLLNRQFVNVYHGLTTNNTKKYIKTEVVNSHWIEKIELIHFKLNGNQLCVFPLDEYSFRITIIIISKNSLFLLQNTTFIWHWHSSAYCCLNCNMKKILCIWNSYPTSVSSSTFLIQYWGEMHGNGHSTRWSRINMTHY